MGLDQVRAILGPPNSVFPSDKPAAQQIWAYYGAAGYTRRRWPRDVLRKIRLRVEVVDEPTSLYFSAITHHDTFSE